jgi:acetyl-CoA carboxylase biotin carboxyl carrier protein
MIENRILDTKNQTNSALQSEYWRGLAQIVRDEDLAELEVERDGIRITLRGAVQAVAAGVVVPSPSVISSAARPFATSSPLPQAASEEDLAPIVSPMVGMFYCAPSPSDPNFVEIGDKVEVGQTVALVEAMKVFNEITAEVAGTVVEIKAHSGDLVETGQILMTIRP